MQRHYIDSPGACSILVTDTITILQPQDDGAVVVSGSHGGVSSAQFVLNHSLAGVFYNDAGIGKDGAGVAGLAVLDEVGLPAAAVDNKSAIIGDGDDTWRSGIISRANGAAGVRGVHSGQSVGAAAAMLSQGPAVQTRGARSQLNRRTRSVAGVDVLLLDSISMLRAEAAGAIVVSGSHGGAVSAEFAARHRPALTVFNDAGIGKADAGCAALPILSRMQLAAVTIDCNSGRIGDPSDIFESGVISRVNTAAAEFGILPGNKLDVALAAFAASLAGNRGR